jgi:hypothetical protein
MALGGAIESFYFALIKNCQFNLTPLMADPQSAMEEAKVDWKVFLRAGAGLGVIEKPFCGWNLHNSRTVRPFFGPLCFSPFQSDANTT